MTVYVERTLRVDWLRRKLQKLTMFLMKETKRNPIDAYILVRLTLYTMERTFDEDPVGLEQRKKLDEDIDEYIRHLDQKG